ncbi:TRAM domain-containing protein [Candidatus Gottesmanbacteria bacterium]|nr:TRAM domain-containing protein [Candidatus Gottesmanbacteria bacterium]
MKKEKIKQTIVNVDQTKVQTEKAALPPRQALAPTAAFTQALAREIVKNLTALGQLTTRFRRPPGDKKKAPDLGLHPMLVDTSVLIDGRILPVVNSGFLTGTLVIPQFILGEVQHIADSSDSLRRTKGRRGLEIVGKLRSQRANLLVKTKIVSGNGLEAPNADLKLVELAKRWRAAMITVDFNMAAVARVQGVKVLNINDLAQAMKVALVPGEEFTVKITHEGRERMQGVGYLADGTMVVVDNARDRVGADVSVIITKVHQTPAGQLFFARLK